MKAVDPILYLLLIATFASLGLLIFVEFKFPSDGQVFQLIAGLVTGFSAAFFLRVKPATKEEDKVAHGDDVKETITQTSTLTSAPPETK